MINSDKPIISLSDKAATHIKMLVAGGDEDVIGVRIGVKSAGCSGMKYLVEYATEKKPFEDSVTEKRCYGIYRSSFGDVSDRV